MFDHFNVKIIPSVCILLGGRSNNAKGIVDEEGLHGSR